MTLTAILDVDGTLVDSNYQHALTWYRALRRHGETIPVARIHRHIGMGGDQIVPALVDEAFEASHGDAVRELEGELYMQQIEEIAPLPGALDLIRRLAGVGHAVVLASSAKEPEIEHYVDLLGAREVARGWTTSADVENTKPAPELVQVALDRVGAAPEEAVLVGDSTWDCEAAGRAGVRVLAVLSGGFGADELRDAGAQALYESAADLLAQIDETPFRVDGRA